jgi:hypothetical protein
VEHCGQVDLKCVLKGGINMCPKCNQVGCEDGDCMESILIKKAYLLEVPKHKYKQLLKDLGTKKLFHLEQYSDEFNKAIDTLEEIAESKSLEEIEISDESY